MDWYTQWQCGETVEDFDLQRWNTAVLINPAGQGLTTLVRCCIACDPGKVALALRGLPTPVPT